MQLFGGQNDLQLNIEKEIGELFHAYIKRFWLNYFSGPEGVRIGVAVCKAQ